MSISWTGYHAVVDSVAEARRHWNEHGWSKAADGMAAVTSIMRAQQIYLARVENVLRDFDISFARYEVLMLLLFGGTGKLPMRVIGSRLQVHPTSVTNAVDRLERAGLVVRRPHPSDRRTTLIEITPPGRRLAQSATQRLNTDVFEQPGLNRREVRSLVDVLGQLRASAGDF